MLEKMEGKPVPVTLAMAAVVEKLAKVKSVVGVAPKKRVRLRPRKYSESMALCRAVFFDVREARRSGKIESTQEGYRVRW